MKTFHKIAHCGHRQLVRLADVAHIEQAIGANLPGRETLGAHLPQAAALEAPKRVVQSGSRLLPCAHGQAHSLREVLHHIGPQNPQCRKASGKLGHQHARHSQGGSEFASMQTAGAAKGDQGVVARIMPPFDRDHANRFFHDGVGHIKNPLGERFE